MQVHMYICTYGIFHNCIIKIIMLGYIGIFESILLYYFYSHVDKMEAIMFKIEHYTLYLYYYFKLEDQIR